MTEYSDSYDNCENCDQSENCDDSCYSCDRYYSGQDVPLIYATWEDFDTDDTDDTYESSEIEESLDDELDAAMEEFIHYLGDPNAVDELKSAYNNVKKVAYDTGNRTVMALFSSPKKVVPRSILQIPSSLPIYKTTTQLNEHNEHAESKKECIECSECSECSECIESGVERDENGFSDKLQAVIDTIGDFKDCDHQDSTFFLNLDHNDHNDRNWSQELPMKTNLIPTAPMVLFATIHDGSYKWRDFPWSDQNDVDILGIWGRLLEGLKLMNDANVIHGDLHDENVILVKTDKWIPKIVNFGSKSYIEEGHLFDFDSAAEDFWFLQKDHETGQSKVSYKGKYLNLLNELDSYMESKKRNKLTFDHLIKSIDELVSVKNSKISKCK